MKYFLETLDGKVIEWFSITYDQEEKYQPSPRIYGFENQYTIKEIAKDFPKILESKGIYFLRTKKDRVLPFSGGGYGCNTTNIKSDVPIKNIKTIWYEDS